MSPYNPPPISSPNPGQYPAPPQSSEERNWAMGCHLSSLCGFVGVPAGNILGPLIVWLLKKNESRFIDEHGRESLNFHISLWIYGLLTGLLWFTVILIPLAILIWGAIYIGGVVCSIIAAVKASNGEHYRYPCTLRLIS